MRKLQQQGRVVKWDESKGFGFIKPADGSKDIFVHISDCSSRFSFGSIGEDVVYKSSRDSRGRICAVDVRLKSGKRSSFPAVFGITLASAFISLIGYSVFANRYFIEVLYLVGAASLITVLLYAKDKSAALKGRRRTPEKTLHLFAIAGGWPGAAISQVIFNHKTSKQPFRFIYWITVFANCGFIAWTFTNRGEYFLFTQILNLRHMLSEIAPSVYY